jgi:hypothetical protein
MTSSDSKIAKIQTHFQALSSAANSLNTASDELTKVVSVLDDALRKLNVGLPVWVTVSRWSDDLRHGEDQIGYCKIGAKWGIALCSSSNDEAGGEETLDGLWLFNDAPRELRLAGIDKIPEVIEALGKEAFDATKRIQQKTEEVRELAGAIGSLRDEAKVRAKALTLAERVAAGQRTLTTNGPATGTLSDMLGQTKQGSK